MQSAARKENRPMKWKTWLTYGLFALFAGLCGTELLFNFRASAERDRQSVRAVRTAANSSEEPEEKPSFDLDRILQSTDLNG